jgi:hypothetical protein
MWWIVYRKSWAGGAKYDVEEMKSILEVNLGLLVEHFFLAPNNFWQGLETNFFYFIF